MTFVHRGMSLVLPGVAAIALAGSAAPASKIEGVRFAPRIEVGGEPLDLINHAVLRYRVFFKAYVAALYLPSGAEPREVLDDVPKRLEIEYFWDIPAEQFRQATLDGIARNVSAGELRELRPSIERLNALYVDVSPGDRYALTYAPGRGTELALNGRALGTLPGPSFATAVFSIWFGEEPFNDELKSALLRP